MLTISFFICAFLLQKSDVHGETLPQEIQNNIQAMVYQIPFQTHPPTAVKDEDVRFFFADRVRNSSILLDENTIKVVDKTRNTKYIIHGWQDHVQRLWLKNMTQAYLEKGDYQIIQVDWQKLASVNYPESVQHTRGIGKIIAAHIHNLNLDLAKLHLIGHSLGGQIAGFAGQGIQQLKNGQKIARITGLDLAGPLFEGNLIEERLDPTDAIFVDVTHSDSGITGYAGATGTVDFWPNGGGAIQPGCPRFAGEEGIIYDIAVATVFCSHFKSVEFFIESIGSKKFRARKCSGYFYYLFGFCLFGGTATFGDDSPSNIVGNYYFRTNSIKPYAMG